MVAVNLASRRSPHFIKMTGLYFRYFRPYIGRTPGIAKGDPGHQGRSGIARVDWPGIARDLTPMLNDIYNRRIIELAGNIPRLGRLPSPDASATAHSKLC